MKKILILTFLSLLGCSTSKINLHPTRLRENLFPQGVYRHHVTLSLHSLKKTYEFDGVVKLSPEDISIVVLSFFGTTEFMIHENLTNNQVQVEIYREEFKKFEPKLKEYYSILRTVLLAKAKQEHGQTLSRQKQNGQGDPLELETLVNGEKIHFYLSDYDKNEIPEKLEIESDHFTVKIKVISYEI